MDNNTVKALSQILDDHLNERTNRSDVKIKINSILHNKKTDTVICELSDYISTLPGKEKNIITLIIIMAALRRNLDEFSKVKEAIIHHQLIGHLYGGLHTLLTGQSERLSLKVELNDLFFENKYEYITRFVDFNYWEYIEVFQAAKVLSVTDSQKFDQLALVDKTKLILLNMASHHLDIVPSTWLILKLIEDDNELYQNLGFHFLVRSITKCVSDFEYIQNSKRNGLICGKKLRDVRNEMGQGLKECIENLGNCKKKTQASLLTNYLLVHQNAYPIGFARVLMYYDLQEEFAYQISQTGKIKTLKDVSFITSLVSRTPAINDSKKRVSKNKLYKAITTVLTSFVEERKGIYGWDEQQGNYFKDICKLLPKSYIRKFRILLSKEDVKLMANKLDELVRFQIFLEDKRQHDIILEMINVIDSI